MTVPDGEEITEAEAQKDALLCNLIFTALNELKDKISIFEKLK